MSADDDRQSPQLPAEPAVTRRPTSQQLADPHIVTQDDLLDVAEQARLRLQQAIDLLSRVRSCSLRRVPPTDDDLWQVLSDQIDSAQRLHRSLGHDPCGWKSFAVLRDDAIAAAAAAHQLGASIRDRLVDLLPGGRLCGRIPAPPGVLVVDAVEWLTAEGLSADGLGPLCDCPQGSCQHHPAL